MELRNENRKFRCFICGALGYDSQMNAPVFTFPLEDEKGIIEVRYNIALDEELYKIFSVIHKDKAGKVQEVLYESGENKA